MDHLLCVLCKKHDLGLKVKVTMNENGNCFEFFFNCV